MKMSTKALIIAVLVTASILVFPVGMEDADSDGSWMLFDHGNGDTEWVDISGSAGTVGNVVKSSAISAGLQFVAAGDTITIDGLTSVSIGSPGSGTLISSGSTGVTVTSTWQYYEWTGSVWSVVSFDQSKAYANGSMAVGFLPSGAIPTETPEYRSSWAMVRGDSSNSGAQTSVYSEEAAKIVWKHPSRASGDYVCTATLIEGDSVYVGFGGGYTSENTEPAYYCYDRSTGEEKWHFGYDIGAGYETASAAIYDGYIFIPATNGNIYKVPLTGPGIGNSDVKNVSIPYSTGHELTGSKYNTGAASLVIDSGVIYCGASNGMIYCFDTDLNLIWSYQTDGSIYYSSPTVSGNQVFMGSLNGGLYAADKRTGALIDSEIVFTVTKSGAVTGLVSPVAVIGDTLMFSYSDGKGMNTAVGGIGIYTFDGEGLTKQLLLNKFGVVSSYVVPVETADFSGVYLTASKGVFRVDIDGEYVLLNDTIEAIKAPMTLLNGEYLIFAEYNAGGAIYELDLNGAVVGKTYPPSDVSNYSMAPVVVIDEWTYTANDGGMYSVKGNLSVVSGSGSSDMTLTIILIVAAVIIAIGAVAYLYLRYAKGEYRPFAALYAKLIKMAGLDDPNISHTKRNKRRLAIVVVSGLLMSFIVFLFCLAYGPSGNLSLGDTFGALISSIEKGGSNLDFNELIVFESRLPRAMVAFAVGVGLSVAGTVYQAIIRNPMVDPYIMGVSSGAGTAAVAVIAFNFTFFGVFDLGSVYLTAVAAIIGGLIAFGATMLIAEKSGGMSINYVLGGVVIGLAFSAVQSLMLSMAGHKVENALAWLFGSFSNVSWGNVWLVFIPALFLSLLPLLWAKELNLVLLGEDQAKQMGLDVRKFNRWMLILASVITAICVAFVGIIGFVGLVVPHFCRMILGGDHRLVLPASMVLGGALMMLADFAAKMLLVPTELPVGAITTIIGVPVFAYLLIKKGRMYDG